MDVEQTLSFRSKVLLVSLLYVGYSVASIVALSIVAANPTSEAISAAVIIAIVTSSLHIITSVFGTLTAAGRTAYQVEPFALVLLGDYAHAAALAAVVATAATTERNGGGYENTPPSVCIAANAVVAAAQLSCFFKAAMLLDAERYDQSTGDRVDGFL